MKRIPRAIVMGPHRVEVKLVTEAEMEVVCKAAGYGDNAVTQGLCDYERYIIYVLKVSKRFPKSLQMHTFWHEYFHMLFWSVGRERLSRDETLVDNCGAMHLQAMQTAEF